MDMRLGKFVENVFAVWTRYVPIRVTVLFFGALEMFHGDGYLIRASTALLSSVSIVTPLKQMS